jgi:cyclophilin family peptidyl-prolyl cis-trans isomerase
MKRYLKAMGIMAAMIFTTTLAMHAQEPVVTHTAVISTTSGNIKIELYGNDAPKTVENFVGLAKKGFYRGIRFHRVVPNFVIQGGDPKTTDTTLRDQWGKGGESIYGKPFEDELNPNAPSYRRGYIEGTLAMANRGPNTNTSQFFIVLSNDASTKLQKLYTIFGKVVEGMDVVHLIEKGDLLNPKSGLPVKPSMILDVKVTEVASTGK